MNTEAALLSAICKNKDIATVLTDNVDDIFISHRDVWEGLKSYYLKFRSVPDSSVLVEKFPDFEPEQVKGGRCSSHRTAIVPAPLQTPCRPILAKLRETS